MTKMVRTGLLLIVSATGASACTSLLGGFDFDGAGGSSTASVSTASVSASSASSSAASSSAASSAASSSSSTGGPECIVPADCMDPGNVCLTRTCDSGNCGTLPVANGTLLAAQTAGDCKKNTCDGAGSIVAAIDNTDLPVDANQCTDNVCMAGAPSNPNSAAGGACSQAGGTKCDGAGACVECLSASTCPGVDTACQSRTCTVGACGIAFAPDGTICGGMGSFCMTGDCCIGGACP